MSGANGNQNGRKQQAKIIVILNAQLTEIGVQVGVAVGPDVGLSVGHCVLLGPSSGS